MRTIVALGMVVMATTVEAAPITLLCAGVLVRTVHQRDQPEQRDSHSLIVDIATEKLTLDGEELPIYFVSDSTINAGFSPPGRRWVLVTLGRITGKVSINTVLLSPVDMATAFDGVCKPAQKLF